MITKRTLVSPLFLLAACGIMFLAWTAPARAQGTQQQVDLSSVFNVAGVYTDGTTFSAGLDGGGAAYSANLLGSTLTLPAPSGVLFKIGPANSLDAVSGCFPVSTACTVSAVAGPINLPAGQFTVLQLLGTGVQGGQSGTVTVAYTDGTSSTFTQGFSDWFSGGPYNTSESVALLMNYRDIGNGTKDNRPFRVYSYAFVLDASKTVQTLTLPNNRNIVILAATLLAIPGYTTVGGAANPPTVHAGSSATAPVTVTSEAGYSGTVTLSCTVTPSIPTNSATIAPTCSFSPGSVSVAPGVPGSSTVTFTPAAGKSAALEPRRSRFYAFWLWLPIPGVALFGLGLGSSGSRRKKLLTFLLLGALLAGLAVTPACVTYTHLGNVGTPPGPYIISITGSDTSTPPVIQFGSGGTVSVTVQ